MSADRRPMLVKAQPMAMTDRLFWVALRQALLLIVSAIERRHLPGLKKCEIERHPRDVV